MEGLNAGRVRMLLRSLTRRAVGPALPESQKVIAPIGELVGIGATVPVRVMLCPSNPGFGEIAIVVVVLAAGSIVTVTGSDVETSRVPFPL
jgi:hypothetical protein